MEFLQKNFFNSCATLSQQNENAGPGCHGDFAVIAGGHWYVLSVSLSLCLVLVWSHNSQVFVLSGVLYLVTELLNFCAEEK